MIIGSSRATAPRTSWIVGSLMSAALVSAAGASVSVSDPFFTITATGSGGNTGTFSVPLASASVFADVDFDVWVWAAAGSNVPILDGSNNVVGIIGDTSITAYRNTQPSGEVRWGIDINFNLFAGPTDTTFEITSPLLSVGAVANPLGLASAGLVGTDQNANGISITPAYVGAPNFGFEALFNGGNSFRQYLDQAQVAGPNGTLGQSGDMAPPGSLLPMGPVVNDLQFKYKFTLTAGDSSGGSGTYGIVPAPGAAGLLGLGALSLIRRRSR